MSRPSSPSKPPWVFSLHLFFWGCLLPNVQRCFQSTKDSAGVRLKIPILRQLLWARPALLANSNSALRTEILKHLKMASTQKTNFKKRILEDDIFESFKNDILDPFVFFGCFFACESPFNKSWSRKTSVRHATKHSSLGSQFSGWSWSTFGIASISSLEPWKNFPRSFRFFWMEGDERNIKKHESFLF